MDNIISKRYKSNGHMCRIRLLKLDGQQLLLFLKKKFFFNCAKIRLLQMLRTFLGQDALTLEILAQFLSALQMGPYANSLLPSARCSATTES